MSDWSVNVERPELREGYAARVSRATHRLVARFVEENPGRAPNLSLRLSPDENSLKIEVTDGGPLE